VLKTISVTLIVPLPLIEGGAAIRARISAGEIGDGDRRTAFGASWSSLFHAAEDGEAVSRDKIVWHGFRAKKSRIPNYNKSSLPRSASLRLRGGLWHNHNHRESVWKRQAVISG
jgi:hypothetical protein